MAKQKCYKCANNTTGEIREIDGKEIAFFDCKIKQAEIQQDFNKECEHFKPEYWAISHEDF